MRTSLDNYLGIHTQALTLEAKRNELLAANLANVDTPNYKARDIDFKTALSAASGNSATTGSPGLTLQQTNASQQASAVDAAAGTGNSPDASLVRYRVPMAPSLDGNTVDEQLEQSAFAENVVRYQATLTFLNNALRGLMTAITGS